MQWVAGVWITIVVCWAHCKMLALTYRGTHYFNLEHIYLETDFSPPPITFSAILQECLYCPLFYKANWYFWVSFPKLVELTGGLMCNQVA